MMSRSLMEKLGRKLTSFSPLKRKILVSLLKYLLPVLPLNKALDVIVLTAMGEQAAIEAKEAPRS